MKLPLSKRRSTRWVLPKALFIQVLQGVLTQTIRQEVAEDSYNAPCSGGIGQVILGLLEYTSDELS